MCVFDCKTENQQKRARKCVCECGLTVRLSLPALQAALYTEINDCIFIVGSEQLRHKCWKSCVMKSRADTRNSNGLHYRPVVVSFFNSRQIGLKSKKNILSFPTFAETFLPAAAARRLRPLPLCAHSHGAAVHGRLSLHGPLQRREWRLIMLEGLFPPLSFPSLRARLPPSPAHRPSHGMWASSRCSTISSLFVSYKQRARSAPRKNMFSEATRPRWFSAGSTWKHRGGK